MSELDKMIATLRGTPQPDEAQVAAMYKEVLLLSQTLPNRTTAILFVMDSLVMLLAASEAVGHDLRIYVDVMETIKTRMEQP